jgi:hypothetical protein
MAKGFVGSFMGAFIAIIIAVILIGILAYVFCKAKTVDFFFYTIFAASVIIWGLVLLMIGAVYLPNKFGLCFGDFVPVTILVGALHAAVAIVYVMFFTFFEWIFNDKKK